MPRVYGPRPELGCRLLHGHHAPIADLGALAHVSESVCLPEHAFAAHRHDVVELCYVLSGKGERIQAGERLQLQAGDLCIARPGEDHGMRADRSHPYHYFALAFHPAQLAMTASPASHTGEPATPDAPALAVLGHRIVRGMGGAEHILRRIIDELDRMEADPRLRELTRIQVTLLVMELLVLGSRRALAAESGPGPTAHPRTPRRADFVGLVQWLESRLGSPPSLPEMAARVRLTPSHFTVAFRTETGLTPVDWLLTRRAEAAARRLLADRSQSITDIAHELGFSTSQYFSHVFRAKTGLTPSQWRAAHPV